MADSNLNTKVEEDGALVEPKKMAGFQEKPTVELPRLQFVLVFIALALSILLAALDQTIVSTALPEIVTVFKAADLISWVGSGYFLTATAFSPVYGKFADVFGRKQTLLFAIGIFEIGSLICGAANSIEMLIAGRVIQGIGGGGIFSLVLIVIADIVTFQDRGKFQGIIGAVFGLASVVGPLAGGAFTDYVSWRWCFYINLPIGGFTFLVILFFLRFPKREETSIWLKLKSIDYLGFLVTLAGVTSLLLPIQFGGTVWPWDAWYTILCFVLFAVFAVTLFMVEWKVAKDPIIPGRVFENNTVFACLSVAFLLGTAFFALSYYVPTYFQVVLGDNATVSGLKTIPFIFGIVSMSISSGFFISRTGRMQLLLFIGSPILVLGVVLLSTLDVDTPYWKIAIFLFISGMGGGLMIQTRLLALQASVKVQNIAVATSLSNFFQTMGGAVGIALFGVIFTNKLYDNLVANLNPNIVSKEQLKLFANSPNAIRRILKAIPGGEAVILPGYLNAFAVGLRYAYYATIPFAGFIFFIAFFVIVRPRQSQPPASTEEKKEVEINMEAYEKVPGEKEKEEEVKKESYEKVPEDLTEVV